MESISLLSYINVTSHPSALLPIHPDSTSISLSSDEIRVNQAWKELGTNDKEQQGPFGFLEEGERDTLAGELNALLKRTGAGSKGEELVLGADSQNRRAFKATFLPNLTCIVLTTSPAYPLTPVSSPTPPALSSRPSLFSLPTLRSLTGSPPTLRATAVPGQIESYIDALLECGVMGKLVAEFKWETTPLGMISTWSAALRSSVLACLVSPTRSYLVWGPAKTFIYNDEYIGAAMTKHPWILGKPFAVAWSEVWSGLEGLVQNVLAGNTFFTTSQHLPLLRNGILEESYHTYGFMPVRDEAGVVQGVSNFSFETTEEVLSQRRMATVNDLVQRTARTKSLTEFCQTALDALSQNPYDLPFVQIYTSTAVDTVKKRGATGLRRKQDAPVRPSSMKVAVKFLLQGSIGIPEGHPLQKSEVSFHFNPSPLSSTLAPSSLSHDLDTTSSLSSASTASSTPPLSSATSTPAFSWPFKQACEEREPVFVTNCAEALKTLPGRAWGQNPNQAIVMPVFTEGDAIVPQAILVFGLNPRSVFTDLYRAFTAVIGRNTAIGLLSVTNAEADARRAEELLALDRSKTKFFSNTSHELRTPLTLILAPMEDMLADSALVLPKEVRRQLEVVTKNAHRLLAMVNKLLDFSAIEGGRMHVRFEPVNMGKLTVDLASLFRDAIQSAGLKFEVETQQDQEDWAPVYMSRDLYTHVLNNLLSNALKYTQRGFIRIVLHTTQREASLSVEDSGLGIPSDQLASIFERFHRVESTAHSASGTGIGLALTLEVVKALGGNLSVSSEVGQGSTFKATFQRGFAHLPADQVVHERKSDDEVGVLSRNLQVDLKQATYYREEAFKVRRPTLSTRPSSESTSTRSHSSSAVLSSGSDSASSMDMLDVAGATILLAEDSSDLRAYISSLLRPSYKIIEVCDGQEALEYALRSPPALVITDIEMPRLSGDELFAALRSNPITCHIPVICLSAQAGAEARTQALERGVDDYLVKPFQSRELLARTKLHLQLGKMRSLLELRVRERTAALNASESKFRRLAERHTAITNSVPTGIFLMDAGPNIVYTNGRFHEISGQSTERPLTDWQVAVHPDDLDRLVRVTSDITDGRVTSGSLQFRYKNGTWVQLEFRAVSDFEDDIAYVGSITDITHEKRMEGLHMAEVEQRAADADAHRQHIENFIDIASHEIRNPLSGVWQNAELISNSMRKLLATVQDFRSGSRSQRDMLTELQEELSEDLEGVQAILICAAHQRRIADDILNVSKLNMGLVTVNRLSFNLPEKIDEVVKMFRVECQSKNISLELVIDKSVEEFDAEWIVADPNRLAQACVNFILNGIKFITGPGSIVALVTASREVPPMKPSAFRVGHILREDMSTYSSPVWVSVSIKDSGKGINDEEMRKLFDRFSQVNPKTDQYGGSGLGLYVSKKLLELHHGFIEVVSTPGKGSTFQFTIPAERGIPSAFRRPSLTTHGSSQNTIVDVIAQHRAGRGASMAVARPQAPQISDRQRHLLVVEDNVINQKVLKRQLTLKGFRVSLANHGREALDILYPPNGLADVDYIDCILMDIEMPVLGGLDTIKELREREASQPIRSRYGVIAVTGNAREEQREIYLSAGFTDVAIKPYAFDRLMEQIESVLASE